MLRRLVGLVLRRSVHRGRTIALCAGLFLVAAIVGGGIGVVIAILTLLIVVDALVPLPGAAWSEADDHFRRLVAQRRRDAWRRRLRREPPAGLEVLDDRGGWASRAERRALGVQSIPLDSVTGTVEGFKARTFDHRFRPDEGASEHWKRLWVAHARGATVPPISVYRVDGRHYVRDGHHRVSVARDHGAETIDAEVVELHHAPRY